LHKKKYNHKQNLILAWAELRHRELIENWQLAGQEQLLQKIKGLE